MIGGQACILYGAAEFSRDLDLVLLLSPDNINRLQALIADLRAEAVAVPPFAPEYLERGHFVHFRCGRDDVNGIRIDVAARLRGVAPFDDLWTRRRTIALQGAGPVNLLSLPDLVASKKSQRDKDWVMIRRLLEVDYFTHRDAPGWNQLEFWLQELRTPDLLMPLAAAHDAVVRGLTVARPLLEHALTGDREGVELALTREMERERAEDRAYWEPLRRELEALRRGRGAS